MTAPLAPAAPAPAPAPASPAATDAPGGRERFASALDDAVAGGQGGPRGQERAAETDGAPAEPAPETPAGEQPVAEQPVAGQPAVSGAGMPPGLWALLTGIGPGAPGPANAVDHAGSAVAAVADTVAAGTVAAPHVVLDGVPAAVPSAGVPTPAPTGSTAGSPAGSPAGAVPVPDAPAADAVLPATPGPAPMTATADPLPGITVVLAAADAPATPTAPELVAPDSVVPLPQPAAAPAPAEGAGSGTGTGSAPDQDAPAAAPAPAPGASPAAVAAPAVPTTAPAPATEPTAPPAPAPPVSGQVAQQVAVLRTAPDGTHTMTVVLTPETLGPVEVQVTLSQGSVDLALKSATEVGRAALLEALPDLRRDLASAGLTCTNASVDRDAGASWASAQQQATGERAGQQGQPDGRDRPWLRGTEADPGRTAPGNTATPSSGLDVRV
ncbi:flagellar hook-length control protein FliK [Geodermatophilus obscurus]|uniref:Flagellar hook-length control protein n=1 Tax=Geodermatophilus obscurus (strain ATCC 25078 / DSM 43160 / JCM 3152 / CCUG 61914 / KCC A-0152 / KCTC 9177 / NBRC 13315 / NRRL B-3577 / G-20) TaxID=526225 RepID=D2S9M0_GEOOG|nr:flagellar hook-length control protein FliK [Geodermatophilus obscurus]ADB73733.1 flagellar hook-length control protein [Geodermatophilus obscurus DSM 43160]